MFFLRNVVSETHLFLEHTLDTILICSDNTDTFLFAKTQMYDHYVMVCEQCGKQNVRGVSKLLHRERCTVPARLTAQVLLASSPDEITRTLRAMNESAFTDM